MNRYRYLWLATLCWCAAVAASPTASVELLAASATLTQTADTQWLLEKVGARTGNSVSWVIGATEQQTVAGQLVVQGQMTVTNSGAGPATIGNVVVNLQTRVGRTWATRSSDIADATDGDAATSASLHAASSSEGLGTFSENSASGRLQFMDATSNTLFALVPQVVLAPGESRPLLFQAAFDNNLLGIATGALVRAEVIVSFGNATRKGNSTPDVDINGNGTIDADEAYVRSVPARFTLAVPAPTVGTGDVMLTDTLDDLVTTGDVTFSNAHFDLSATTGTVTVTVDGGATGGTITNCAHLTSDGQTATSGGFTFPVADGIDLEACDTLTIGPRSCTAGTAGCGWADGDVISYSQSVWGGTPSATNPAGLLAANYGSVYSSTSGVFEVGIPGTGGFSMVFTGVNALLAYLPVSGVSGALTSDLANPTSSSSGIFGGNVAALKLNVDFSDVGLTLGASGLRFGDLTLCNFPTQPALEGLTVRQYLGVVNTLLGGGSGPYPISDLSPLTGSLNSSFTAGGVAAFAQDHLVNGACP